MLASAAEGVGEQLLFGRREWDECDGGCSRRRHLASGLAEHVEEVLAVEFGGHVGQLGLDERKAGSVFDGLGACVDGQVVAPDERLHPNQGVPTRAWRAACSSCHSDSPAIAHIDANTSIAGAEACAVCHGADDTLSVTNVHKLK